MTRRVSLMHIMTIAKMFKNRQFIFITPQDVRSALVPFLFWSAVRALSMLRLLACVTVLADGACGGGVLADGSIALLICSMLKSDPSLGQKVMQLHPVDRNQQALDFGGGGGGGGGGAGAAGAAGAGAGDDDVVPDSQA